MNFKYIGPERCIVILLERLPVRRLSTLRGNHPGNILWTDSGQLEDLLEGYQTFYDFDRGLPHMYRASNDACLMNRGIYENNELQPARRRVRIRISC